MSGIKKLKGRPNAEEQVAHQEHLLAIAQEEFLANGYNATSIDALARKAGISKLTVYRRFGSKEGLFLAVADRVIDNTTQVPKVRVDGLPLNEALLIYARAILDAYLDPVCLAVVRLVVAEAVQFPDVAQRYHNDTLRVLEGFASYLDSMMEQGQLRRCDPAQAARNFTYMCIDGVRFLVTPPPPPGPEREAWCQYVVETFLRGHHP